MDQTNSKKMNELLRTRRAPESKRVPTLPFALYDEHLIYAMDGHVKHVGFLNPNFEEWLLQQAGVGAV